MTNSLQLFMNGRLATGIGLTLSHLPPRLGYAVARRIADILAANKDNPMVQAVRANQWVASGETLNGPALDKLVRATFRSSARSMYEFWHYLHDNRTVLHKVVMDPTMEATIERANHSGSGTIMVTPHVSNFDLVGRALVLHGMDMHILSYPQPPSGYRWQNQLREVPGVMVSPMSIQALRKASETLRRGRTVVTGIDRPLPEGEDAKYQVSFFGRRAALPVFHIRLALKHHLPITVLGGCRGADGRYRVWSSEPIPLRRYADLMEETVLNTEAILRVVAEVIRRAPEQWAMFYPVWPEALAQVPA
jgi:KDO2-lipid IV(A) lauroyltransferase